MYLINVYLYLYLYLKLELYFQKKKKNNEEGIELYVAGGQADGGPLAGRWLPRAQRPNSTSTLHSTTFRPVPALHSTMPNVIMCLLSCTHHCGGQVKSVMVHGTLTRNILVRARCILVQSSKWCWYPVKEEQLHRKSTGFGRPGLQSPQHQSQSPPNQNYLNCRSPPLLSTLSYSRPSDKFRISTFYIPLQFATFHQNSTRGNELQQTSFTGGQLNCQTQKFTITDRTLTC